MRTSRGMKFVALAAAGGLALAAAACSKPPADPAASPGATSFKACLIMDTGGVDDHSFNQAAWGGLQAAKKANSKIEIKNTASNSGADYNPNLTAAVTDKCNFIQAAGGLMADDVKKVAGTNPKLQFSIVDGGNQGLDNVFPIQFETQQAAFLAGYLAAGYSKTGKVGTYGGMKIPPVTIFMDGFADGVAHYNKTKSKTVQLLGWDKATQNGLFTQDFVKQDLGKQQSDALVGQGADVIMPVAGGAGLGTTSSAKEKKFTVIWVDSDGFFATSNKDVILSTVIKDSTKGVEEAATKSATDPTKLLTGGFLGTLANGGVALAPYHDLDSTVPAELKAEIEALKADIISGKIPVTSAAQPK